MLCSRIFEIKLSNNRTRFFIYFFAFFLYNRSRFSLLFLNRVSLNHLFLSFLIFHLIYKTLLAYVIMFVYICISSFHSLLYWIVPYILVITVILLLFLAFFLFSLYFTHMLSYHLLISSLIKHHIFHFPFFSVLNFHKMYLRLQTTSSVLL